MSARAARARMQVRPSATLASARARRVHDGKRMSHANARAIVLLALGSGLIATEAVATVSPRVSETRFEGRISMRATSTASKGPRSVTVEIKGSRARVDLSPAGAQSADAQGRPLQAIVDQSNRRLVLVNPDQRTYAVLAMTQIPSDSRQATELRIDRAAANWTAVPSGATTTIAGHRCTQWKVRNAWSSDQIDACLAPDVRIDYAAILPQWLVPGAWTEKLRTGELPLSASGYDASGRTIFAEQVISVRPQPVPDTDFEPPATYERVDLPISALRPFLPSKK